MLRRHPHRFVALDFDSTLNNLLYVWCRWCEARYGERCTPADVSHWAYQSDRFGKGVFDFICPESYNTVIQALPGAPEFLRALEAAYGEANVQIVTTTPEGIDESKLANIERTLQVGPERVVLVRDHCEKQRVTAGALLIDDYPTNVLEHIEAHRAPGVVFNYGGQYPYSALGGYAPERVAAAGNLLHVCTGYEQILAGLGLNAVAA